MPTACISSASPPEGTASGTWPTARRSGSPPWWRSAGGCSPRAERREAILPPDSGPPYPVIARRIRSLPVWIWHGGADSVVPVEESRRMADALREAGAAVAYTELPGVGHESWVPAFESAELPRWLLARTQGSSRGPRRRRLIPR